MRTLILLRGAPGSGKSTWISNNNLKNYTLSPDDLRVLCSSLDMQPTGELKIAQNYKNEKFVWNKLFELLEYRMEKGEFTIIDATCSRDKDIKRYNFLANKYNYKLFIIDFSDVPLETCLKQNKMRNDYKQVPDEVIEKIYERFSMQKIPNNITIIKKENFDTLLVKPLDFSFYSKLVFIGDIHGCYDTLMEYKDFKEGLKDDTEYIFLGDYEDRGNQNKEVLSFIESIKDKPNVCLLEGNHEEHLKHYGEGEESKSPVFNNKTKAELIEKNFSRKSANELCRKLKQFCYITYNGLEILACHGGIPNLNMNLLYVPAEDFIHGVGSYIDLSFVTSSWMKQTKDNQFLIHGHRNIEKNKIKEQDRVFNLEGQVEFGGQLRILELTKDLKWNYIYINSKQPEIKKEVHDSLFYLNQLRNNNLINEKDLGNGISSFNFSRKAFNDRMWNKQTILARGLFLNNKTGDVISRSYEKFFKINETESTQMNILKEKLKFPVTAYVKENGFLGIVSYLKDKDELFVTSKSTNDNDFVTYFKQLLFPYQEDIKKLFKDNILENCSLVFEVIDIKNDPHIIKYEKSHLVLLDIIKNSFKFQKESYEVVQDIGKRLKIDIKKQAYILNTWNDFENLYNKIIDVNFKYENKYIEGFVFEDSNNFMVKAKSGYYDEWKKMRGISQTILKKGHLKNQFVPANKVEESFYNFVKKLYDEYYKESESYPFLTDIISLRDMFLNK